VLGVYLFVVREKADKGLVFHVECEGVSGKLKEVEGSEDRKKTEFNSDLPFCRVVCLDRPVSGALLQLRSNRTETGLERRPRKQTRERAPTMNDSNPDKMLETLQRGFLFEKEKGKRNTMKYEKGSKEHRWKDKDKEWRGCRPCFWVKV
jgi:hypothetical protein